MRGQSSLCSSLENFHKENKVLGFPSTHELSLSFCWRGAKFYSRVEGKGATYHQKAEERRSSLTVQEAPSAHLGVRLPGGEQSKHIR